MPHGFYKKRHAKKIQKKNIKKLFWLLLLLNLFGEGVHMGKLDLKKR